ncbi:ABC transporter ATP-binding protein [uncultured Robinsoniella sp.]|uniref:ABC transporter ATP-binding protein n=1 Tax=uncultured Robinsoniella sp. TaxID=904190 RepID=UPI00374E345E
MKDALCVTNLSKSYEDFTLQNISFSIPTGSVMGLIGKNGSGKTTTIKLILNLLKCQTGSVSVLGMDHIKQEQEFKERIGVVFDSHFFVDEWKMPDVEKSMGMFYKNWNRKIFYRYLSDFNIGKNKRVKELSKGMQMKLMLACSFSHKAELLILDEPTSGLDPVSRDELLDILAEYTEDQNHSVLFSTHITPDLNKIADSITFINNGKLLYTGEKEDFTEMYLIVSGYKGQLTEDIRALLLSTKMSGDHFEGLVRADHLSEVSHLKNRHADIDDIIVFMDKGDF